MNGLWRKALSYGLAPNDKTVIKMFGTHLQNGDLNITLEDCTCIKYSSEDVRYLRGLV